MYVFLDYCFPIYHVVAVGCKARLWDNEGTFQSFVPVPTSCFLPSLHRVVAGICLTINLTCQIELDGGWTKYLICHLFIKGQH